MADWWMVDGYVQCSVGCGCGVVATMCGVVVGGGVQL